MKNKLSTVLIVLLISMLSTSIVFAGGAVKLSNSQFQLGSLIATGFASGLGNTDWVLVLDSTGHAGVICTNYGGNDVPGQSHPHVEGVGVTTLPGNDPLRKNGRSPYAITAKSAIEEIRYIPWDEGGCPNSNWTARVDFIYWDFATITAYDPSDIDFLNPVVTYQYQCVTTYTGPNGTPSTFDDGVVSCKLISSTRK